ncbi:MucBP domain-containing protein, partial [Vagococcus elongatus]
MKRKFFSLIAVTMLIVPSSLTSIFSAGEVFAAESGKEMIADQSSTSEPVNPIVPDENLQRVSPDGTGKIETEPEVKWGKVIVRYMDDSGNKIDEPEIRTGKVGANYLSTKREYEGYELVEIPANARGQFIDGEIVVTYVYKKIETEPEVKWGKVIVRYMDDSGNKIDEPEIRTGKVGDNYLSTKREYKDYELVEIPANARGQFIDGEIVVT